MNKDIKGQALREELIGALIGLAKTCGNNPKTEDTDGIILKGLSMTGSESGCTDEERKAMLGKVREEKHQIAPDCSTCQHPCGNTDDYDLSKLAEESPEIRELKTEILAGIRQYAIRLLPVYESERFEVETLLFYRALAVIGYDMEAEDLQAVLHQVSHAHVRDQNTVSGCS